MKSVALRKASSRGTGAAVRLDSLSAWRTVTMKRAAGEGVLPGRSSSTTSSVVRRVGAWGLASAADAIFFKTSSPGPGSDGRCGRRGSRKRLVSVSRASVNGCGAPVCS